MKRGVRTLSVVEPCPVQVAVFKNKKGYFAYSRMECCERCGTFYNVGPRYIESAGKVVTSCGRCAI